MSRPPRTPSRMADLHFALADLVREVARAHRAAYPDRTLALIWAHRTPAEQAAAYAAGRSRIDGRRRFSLHNYLPALAADLWVYTGGDEDTPELYEGRPPRSDGLELQLMQRGSFRRYYRPMGQIAEREGLEWGGRWRRLRDGPHIQLDARARGRILQQRLAVAGADPGAIDGIIGRRTRAAVTRAALAAGVAGLARGPMPVHPALWAWLHRDLDVGPEAVS